MGSLGFAGSFFGSESDIDGLFEKSLGSCSSLARDIVL
jgi:hypothetical protein